MLLRLSPILVLLFVAGCTPEIGDSCQISTDCSQLGDRLCDTTQPEGYCTMFNCEPDTCPEAVCVGFNFELDPACGKSNDGRWGRFERTYCMAPCTDTTDCRSDEGYICLAPSARQGRIVDEAPLGNLVCMAPTTLLPRVKSSSTPQVCDPGDAGVMWTPFKPDGGTP